MPSRLRLFPARSRLRLAWPGLFASATLLLLTVQAVQADYNAEYRKNCRVLTKYRLRVNAICNNQELNNLRIVDTGCGYAQAIARYVCSTIPVDSGSAYISARIGSGAWPRYAVAWGSHSKTAPSGLGRDRDQLALAAGSFVMANFTDDATFDSVQREITVTLDSSRFQIFGDAGFAVLRVTAWLASDDSDSIMSSQKIFWDGRLSLENKEATFSGEIVPADFSIEQEGSNMTATANGLTKVIPFSGTQEEFERVVLNVYYDGGHGLPSLPPVVPVPASAVFPLVLASGVLAAAGFVAHRRRSGIRAQ